MKRFLPLILALLSLGLLIPGVCLPVLTIRGDVDKAEGILVMKTSLIEQMAESDLNKAVQEGKPIEDETAYLNAQNKVNAGLMMLKGLAGVDLADINGKEEVFVETRSILSAVEQLFEGGDHFVGCLIITFSVIIPGMKLLCLAIFTFSNRQVLLKISGTIAKWSMVDAFVLAIMVAFFAANVKDLPLVAIDAKFEIGFFFFLAYCLASIASSQATSWFSGDKPEKSTMDGFSFAAAMFAVALGIVGIFAAALGT
ncbi:MAG: hypothetical protein ACI8UO_000045 [Verrucomicrobiales bacterium]|jgi:hypothetical protein